MASLTDIPHTLVEYLRAALSSPYTTLPGIPRVSRLDLNHTVAQVGTLANKGAMWNARSSVATAGTGPAARLSKQVLKRAIHLENLEIVDRGIDARSAVTLAVFFIVNILVIFPLRIPLPLILPKLFSRIVASQYPSNHTSPSHKTSQAKISAAAPTEATVDEKPPNDAAITTVKAEQAVKRWYFVLGLETAPVIGWLLLLAATCIDGSVIRNGIVGGAGVRPYDIMTLFLSFAYIAISLDRTNLLRYLAFHVATRAASSGRKLYIAFFVFFSFTGLLVGNDPLILSGTPFLAHFSRLAGIANPTAYLFTQFQTANLVSALLVSSNPTNLVLSSGFGLSFLQYSAWLALPTVASIIVLFPLLRYWVFRREGMIPLNLTPPVADPANALKDPWGAAFGGVVFLITIIVLIALSAVGKLEGVEGVWTVTAPAALLILARDVAYDVVSKGTREGNVRESSRLAGQEKGGQEMTKGADPRCQGSAADEPSTVAATPAKRATPASSRATTPPTDVTAESRSAGDVVAQEQAPPISAQMSRSPSLSASASDSAPTPGSPSAADTKALPTSAGPPQVSANSSPTGPFKALRKRLPTVCSIIAHLPWTLIPFAFSMFILVESLSHTGWIRVFGGWWASWADVGGTAGCIFMMGLIGALGCNLNARARQNLVLESGGTDRTGVMQQWAVLQPDVSKRTFFGAVFALAIGSNFGAYSFVFPASLAGLLWKHLLAQKDMHITRKEFAYWNTVPVIVTMIVGCLVVAGEVCVMLPA